MSLHGGKITVKTNREGITIIPAVGIWDFVTEFSFIDLFAGVGGTRIAFERLGGKCVFASECDKYACKVYEENHKMMPQRDITAINPHSYKIGHPNIVVAGFPCQAFSIAGNRLGFDDERGQMFNYVADIIDAKRPEAFFLENVKGLLSIDGGKTIETILHILRDRLGYFVPEPEIINAKDFGIPQNRERVFIVGFRKDLGIKKFNYPKPIKYKPGEEPKLKDALEKEPVSVKYYLSEGYLSCLERHKKEQKQKGRGFSYQILDEEKDIANTLMTGGMGRERNLIYDHKIKDRTPVTKIRSPVNDKNIRRLTPREFANLMGFNKDFIINVSDVNAYRLFGNSVAIDAVYYTAKQMIDAIEKTNGFWYTGGE